MGDDGYPYGLPLSHYYDEESGKIYFHGSRNGHKIDAINNSDKASFCVHDEGYRKDGEWALNIKSVIVFGKIKMIDDYDKKCEICSKLCRKFTDDEAYIEDEITKYAKRVLVLELTPEHITGKLVNES